MCNKSSRKLFLVLFAFANLTLITVDGSFISLQKTLQGVKIKDIISDEKKAANNIQSPFSSVKLYNQKERNGASQHESLQQKRRTPPPVLEYDAEYYSDYLEMDDSYGANSETDVPLTNDQSYMNHDEKEDMYTSSDQFISNPKSQNKNQRSNHIIPKSNHDVLDHQITREDSYPTSDTFFPNESSYVENSDHSSNPSNKRIYNKKKLMPPSILADLNPSQHEAVTAPIRSITRVIAGPGAGKTRVLTSRIAYLLYKNEEDEIQEKNNYNHISENTYYSDETSQYGSGRILAVTFTKKAAGEMQNRLQNLCIEADSFLQSESQNDDSTNIHDIQQEEIKDENGRPVKPTILNRVTMGTFHSICARILRRNGDLLSTLLPSNIATGTREKDKTSNLDGTFAIIDQSEQIRLVKECLTDKKIKLDDPAVGGGRNGPIKPIQVLNAILKLKEKDLFIPMNEKSRGVEIKIKESKGALKVAREIYPIYTTKLYSSNSVDFNDLILLTRLLLIKHPEVTARLHQIWKHVLVDEFQDTSKAQLDLVKLWTTESLMVVGDSDQSIYSWRGANGVESMRDVMSAYENRKKKNSEKNVKKREVNTVYLMENYRSTTNIVKAAQKIINAGSGSTSTSLHSNSNSSAVDMRKNMKPMRGSGPTPRILACRDAKKEASWVVQQIISMTEESRTKNFYDEKSGDAPHMLSATSSIAIIYRTNAQSRVIEEACVSNNLRYAVRGAAGAFYSRTEVKDCLCFLKWLYNGRDKVAMMRCFKTPSRGIGNVAINEFVTFCEEVEKYHQKYPTSTETRNASPTNLDILISLSEKQEGNKKLPIPPESLISKRALNRFLPFSLQMKMIRQQSKLSTVSELLNYIISSLDLKAHFDTTSKTSSEFADRWSNVMELCHASDRYNEDGPCTIDKESDDRSDKAIVTDKVVDDILSLSPLGSFLDDVALVTENNDDESSSKDLPKRAVANLMTIHAAKGMEFDAVFLVGNEEGTFPTQRAIIEGDGSVELEEERRLCYVAMTRAKTHLFLTWRREVMIFAGQGFKIIDADRSRFLNSLVSTKKKKKKKIQAVANKRNKNETRQPRSGQILSPRRVEVKRPMLKTKKSIKTSSISEKVPLPPSFQGQSWEDWDPAPRKVSK